MKAKLQPELMKNAILILPQNNQIFTKNQSLIALSHLPTKKYSFVTKIDGIEVDESLKAPVLKVNKNIIGLLSEADPVVLYPYNVPAAKNITIGISDEYRTITNGDWTASLRESLLNNIYDIGDTIKSPIDVAGNILIIRGTLVIAKPVAPIFIDGTTTIEIEKFSKEKLASSEQILESEKVTRTDVLENAIFEDMISNIKNANLHKETISFDLNLKSIKTHIFDDSVCSLFDMYELYSEEIIADTKTNYSIVRGYVSIKNSMPQEMISYRITAGKGHGSLIVEYSALETKMMQNKADEIKEAIQKLYLGFKNSLSKKERNQYIQSFILETGNDLQSQGNSQLSLAKLVQSLQESFPDWKIDVKQIRKLIEKMQKNGIIANVEKLEDGFYMIEFHPSELTIDPIQLLKTGQEFGTVSKEILLTQLGWDEYRLQNALDFLIERNMIKKQTSYREGTLYFFKNA